MAIHGYECCQTKRRNERHLQPTGSSSAVDSKLCCIQCLMKDYLINYPHSSECYLMFGMPCRVTPLTMVFI